MSYFSPSNKDRVPDGLTEHLEYQTFHDVITEVRDVLILDLAHYTTQLPSEYAACLLPEPDGVYLYGALNPVTVFDPRMPLYSKQALDNHLAPDITTFEQFISCHSPIVTAAGKLVAKSPKQNARHYKNHCMYPRSAIYLAAISIWDLLNHLHRDTAPYTNLGLQQLVESNYLLQDIDPQTFRVDGQPGISKIQDEVLGFIGRDLHSVYSMRMNNTVVHLEKGLDYRVIEYYRARFDELDDRITSEFGF